MSLNYAYFYGGEADQYSFYRIPKTLFIDQRYKSVSTEAKVLYGLMLDRLGLSIRNGWLDDVGRVFIYFTLEDAMALLSCGHGKAVKLFSELDTMNGIGLIERIKQGQGKPTLIYVKNFALLMDNSLTSENGKSALPVNPEVKTSEYRKSALRKTGNQDFRKSATNKTELNKTDLNETYLSIYPAAPTHSSVENVDKTLTEKQQTDRIDEMECYRELIKKNISFDILLLDKPYDRERLDGFVEMMVEAICCRKKTIRLNQEDLPTEVVKNRLLKLNSEHIRYVMDCLEKNTTRVGNIKAYILSCLYNAPVTMGQYYASLVNYDMANGWNGS